MLWNKFYDLLSKYVYKYLYVYMYINIHISHMVSRGSLILIWHIYSLKLGWDTRSFEMNKIWIFILLTDLGNLNNPINFYCDDGSYFAEDLLTSVMMRWPRWNTSSSVFLDFTITCLGSILFLILVFRYRPDLRVNFSHSFSTTVSE